MFSERLNHVMELTHTKASELARAANLNASYVSRLKNGNRPLPKMPDFLPAMCIYLTRRIHSDYQRDALRCKLNLAAWPVEEREAAMLLERWLLGKAAPAAGMEMLVQSFTSAGKSSELKLNIPEDELSAARRYYYGPEGKQEAVMQFFDRIKKEKSPQTLLLSSDEDMGWMYENPLFTARWAMDFKQALDMGNRVRIIHHVGRDLNELLEAVTKWMPIYMTGMIEPYYYPRLRDGIIRRSLFIAPKSAAVISSSVGRDTEGMLNELIVNPQAIAALVKEYENYFALCRPLMKITSRHDILKSALETSLFFEGGGSSVCMAGAPTLATMPEGVAKSMQERAPKSHILELWQKSSSALSRNLEGYRHTDVLSETAMTAPLLPLPCADFLGAEGLCYTSEELESHRANIQKLAHGNTNYRCVVDEAVPSNLLLYGRGGQGTLMIKSDEPNMAFIISEMNIANAFWDYLEVKAKTPPSHAWQ
ncbi:MAG: hypothetical protein GX025_00125 [Clostridiales bacterium]|nr:hypothetical protein [Clostridiales bacterium]